MVLLQFSILLLLVFILELSGGIAAYVLRDRAHDFLSNKLNESMHSYNENKETQELWYMMQTSVSWLKCKCAWLWRHCKDTGNLVCTADSFKSMSNTGSLVCIPDKVNRSVCILWPHCSVAGSWLKCKRSL